MITIPFLFVSMHTHDIWYRIILSHKSVINNWEAYRMKRETDGEILVMTIQVKIRHSSLHFKRLPDRKFRTIIKQLFIFHHVYSSHGELQIVEQFVYE